MVQRMQNVYQVMQSIKPRTRWPTIRTIFNMQAPNLNRLINRLKRISTLFLTANDREHGRKWNYICFRMTFDVFSGWIDVDTINSLSNCQLIKNCNHHQNKHKFIKFIVRLFMANWRANLIDWATTMMELCHCFFNAFLSGLRMCVRARLCAYFCVTSTVYDGNRG